MEDRCPLCAGITTLHHRTASRSFLRCTLCELVHVPAGDHLSTNAERAVYDLHQNDRYDLGYRRFLSRAVDPLLALLGPGSNGLDFGAGPGPAVSTMLREVGHHCADFDPFYANDPALLNDRYDFVISTEVAEHLRTPDATLDLVFSLAPIVVLMTKRTTTPEAFPGWHYHHDPTHIVFYADETMRWLATRHARDLTLPAPDVAVFSEPRTTSRGR